MSAKTPTVPGSLTERFVVVLTDGTHEAGDEEAQRELALQAKGSSDVTIYTIGIQGTYDACRLEELAGAGSSAFSDGCRVGSACDPRSAPPASCTQFLKDVDRAALSQTFDKIAQRATAIARSNYVVGVCTPVALGQASLTIQVDIEGAVAHAEVSYPTDELLGTVNECEAEALLMGVAGCNPRLECGTDPGNGAACGECSTGRCVANQCIDATTCPPLWNCGGGGLCAPAAARLLDPPFKL